MAIRVTGRHNSELHRSIQDINIDPRDGDGRLELKDEDWTVQYNLGVLYAPTREARLGLTYLSEVDLDFEDRVEFSGLGQGLEAILTRSWLIDAKPDLGMTMPQTVMFSVYHELTNRLALLANLGGQNWSEFGKFDVSVAAENSNSLTADLDYDDTWHVALGAQYQISKPLLLTAGSAYDSVMMDQDQLTPALPVGGTWRFGLGTRYNWSQDVTLDAAYELAWGWRPGHGRRTRAAGGAGIRNPRERGDSLRVPECRMAVLTRITDRKGV